MRKFGVVVAVLGAFVVLGSIGQSDFETLVLGEEVTPFYKTQLLCLEGLTLIGLGALLRYSSRKEGRHHGGAEHVQPMRLLAARQNSHR